MSQLIDFLTSVQATLKDHVFEIFKEPNVAIGLSLLLLVGGVVFIVWLVLVKWIPFALRLRRLEKVIRATKGQFGLVKDFASVDETIRRTRFVRHGWEEFKETLVFPEPESAEPIYNTSRPSEYINISAAETSGLHIRFIQAVPNYFVGVGLLFTFLGLVAAIYFASEGISADADIGKTQERLKDLLGAATFKFLTSIAGILSSLGVGIFYRLVIAGLQKRFDHVCEALEQRLQFATAESIAFDQYRELQKQTIQLQRFNTDLAFSIAKELDTRLSESLPATFAKALAPLASTMDNMADRFGEMNQDAMSSMLDSFTQNLSQSAGSEMKALGDSLAESKDTLSNLASTLQTAGGQLNQTLNAAGQRMQLAASSMEESIKSGLNDSTKELQRQMEQISSTFHDQFTQSSAKFSAAISGLSRNAGEILQPMQEHLEGVTNRLDALSGGLQQQTDSIASLNRELGGLIQNTSAASARLENAGEPVARASEAIGLAASNISETSRSSRDAQEKLAVLSESVSKSVEETTSHWREYANRFEQVDRDLANTFRVLRDGTSEQQAVIREFVTGVDKEFDKALRNLGAGVESLQDNLEEFTAVVDKLAVTLNRA